MNMEQVLDHPLLGFLNNEITAQSETIDRLSMDIIMKSETILHQRHALEINRETIRQFMEDIENIEAAVQRRNVWIEQMHVTIGRLRNENARLRRLNRASANPMFPRSRSLPPSLYRVSETPMELEVEVALLNYEEPLQQTLERLGQEGEEDNFSDNDEM